MNLLLCDVETTDKDKTKAFTIEAAAALFHVETRTVLWAHSAIMPTTATNPAVEINKIADATLEAAGQVFDGVAMSDASAYEAVIDIRDHALDLLITPVRQILPVVDALVAHNAAFDRDFVEPFWGIADFRSDKHALPWICSQRDLAYAKAGASRRLSHLAVDYGVPIGNLHKAIDDVLLLAALLTKLPDLDAQIAMAMQPRARFQALVSYEKRQLAKDAGFAWNSERKAWWRDLPANTPLTASEARPFAMRIITSWVE